MLLRLVAALAIGMCACDSPSTDGEDGRGDDAAAERDAGEVIDAQVAIDAHANVDAAIAIDANVDAAIAIDAAIDANVDAAIDAGPIGLTALPAEFPWTPSWSIVRDGERVYDATLDVASRRITPAIIRYVAPTGDDANDGTSWAQAKRSIDNALGNFGSQALTLYVAAGDYRGAHGWNGRYLYAPTNVIAVGGRARFSTAPTGVAWTAHATYPGVYQATTAAPYGVIDETRVDASGVALWLAAQTSVALVAAVPGSWHAGGGVLTVRTFDGRAPDAAIHPFAIATNGLVINDVDVYVSDCDFLGGTSAFTIQDADQFTDVRVGFLYGRGNGRAVVDATDSVSIDSVAHGTHGFGGGGDGFSYQAVGRHLELRGRAIRNGNDGSQISNGSSSHGATVIRLSGYYGDSDGPNLADVFDSRSFNAGCVMETSRATAPVQAVNVAVDSAASSTSAWLLECHLGGSSISADLRPIDLPDRIYVRATPYRSTSGAGQVLTW